MPEFSVDLAANTRRFQAGVEDAADALAELTDVLEEVADSSRRVEDETTDALKGAGSGADDAKREVRDLTRETDDLADKFREAARRADDLGDDAKRAGDKAGDGMRRASEGAEEFRDEARSTAREAAASFGSVEDAIDAVQELAANAFGGFGPGGMIAGAAAAVGIGLAISAFEAFNEAQEESRRRAAEWAQAYIDAGGTVLTVQQRVAALQAIIGDEERYREAQDNAREWGVALSTALRAMTGDTDALAEAEASLSEREREAAEAAAARTDAGEALSDMLIGQTAETRNGREALEALRGEMRDGQAAYGALSDAIAATAREVDGATTAVDEFGNRVIQLPDGATVTIDARTGAATYAVAEVREDIENLPDGHANVGVSVEDSALRYYLGRPLNRTAYVNIATRSGAAVYQ